MPVPAPRPARARREPGRRVAIAALMLTSLVGATSSAGSLPAPAAGAPDADPRGIAARPGRSRAPAISPPLPSSPASPGARLSALRVRVLRGDPRIPATEVEARTLRFATDPRRRAWLAAALGRMGRHERGIRAALRRQGLPEELLYLPVVESAFREGAISPAGAAGLWQFMPGTARSYGLEVSPYVDERHDPVRSTDAAARHLRDLHGRFGSWHLALAAYNCGAGCVDRALARDTRRRRGDEAPYWAARPRLPRETREYVPTYLAAAALARDPAAFGIDVRPEPPLRFAVARVPGGIPLEAVARAHGLPADTLLRLNPHLVRGMTPPGRPWPVRLPHPPRALPRRPAHPR